MQFSRLGDQIQVFAPAKVNLFLEIVSKRPDGYHNLESLMAQVSLWDTLAFENAPAGELSLEIDIPGLDEGESNLIIKAARLLWAETGKNPGAKMRLTKRIPMEAGMGGGSSDAAAALFGLNFLWGLSLTQIQLQNLGARLGSDVSFFLSAPAALCTGRGELCEPVLGGQPIWLVLVQPDFGLSTKEIYGALKVSQTPHSSEAFVQAWKRGSFTDICAQIYNRLEEPALAIRPEIGLWKSHLISFGASASVMTGSGSVVLGLFPDADLAYKAARRIETGEPSGMMGAPGRVRTVRVVQTLA
jgi:4-diphosphocytidyl-2-C-methyl-D-erythritol kinase